MNATNNDRLPATFRFSCSLTTVIRTLTTLCIACVAVAGTALAGAAPGSGLVGSYHDIPSLGGANADSMGRICVFCHTPHVPAGSSGSFLWNHELSPATYTPYVWTTPANEGTETDKDAFKITDPLAGPTRLCLSCHDGVVAIDDHVGLTMNELNGGRANVGTDLTQSHPIGFDYIAIRNERNAHARNGTDGDSEIVDPDKGFAIAVTEEETAQGNYNRVTRLSGSGAKTIRSALFNGTIMTCATCHDVHNKNRAEQDNFTGMAGTDTAKAPNYLLWAKVSRSLICLSCHVK